MIFPLSPIENDPESGGYRASLFSQPSTMLWGLVVGLALLGFVSWVLWLVAGVLAVLTVLIGRWWRRRSLRAMTAEERAAALRAKRA